MLALHITARGSPEEKLVGSSFFSFFFPLPSLGPQNIQGVQVWAFRMYDVDGSGDIDIEEMKRSPSTNHNLNIQ